MSSFARGVPLSDRKYNGKLLPLAVHLLASINQKLATVVPINAHVPRNILLAGHSQGLDISTPTHTLPPQGLIVSWCLGFPSCPKNKRRAGAEAQASKQGKGASVVSSCAGCRSSRGSCCCFLSPIWGLEEWGLACALLDLENEERPELSTTFGAPLGSRG